VAGFKTELQPKINSAHFCLIFNNVYGTHSKPGVSNPFDDDDDEGRINLQ